MQLNVLGTIIEQPGYFQNWGRWPVIPKISQLAWRLLSPNCLRTLERPYTHGQFYLSFTVCLVFPKGQFFWSNETSAPKNSQVMYVSVWQISVTFQHGTKPLWFTFVEKGFEIYQIIKIFSFMSCRFGLVWNVLVFAISVAGLFLFLKIHIIRACNNTYIPCWHNLKYSAITIDQIAMLCATENYQGLCIFMPPDLSEWTDKIYRNCWCKLFDDWSVPVFEYGRGLSSFTELSVSGVVPISLLYNTYWINSSERQFGLQNPTWPSSSYTIIKGHVNSLWYSGVMWTGQGEWFTYDGTNKSVIH